ncbi:ParB/Srx family N-terminal domain-containing protein [Burkholderia sp. PAMC 26561]|uniref:ParB/Srx family N-terminal domain-containing protein n=1 Tax=Burkholderia sp. PAMC 26561 TaxID=1795043 RepID=UPI00076B42D7|nr:ParB/Srx family N-terminal domain-containing protein [Burkholderia sp. PAMC 26561]AME27363.1 hypothetical protein AXG89_26155 [Burkholderia sp. PAMC 26561]AME27485.1 hypothetical protein AXG89_26535 [Burkholderia sp. PAMC 26561]
MMDDRSVDVAVAENANGSGAIGAVLETSFAETSIASVPLSRLSVSPLNVRRRALTGIEGLADSILAKGLLQNLVAHPAKGSRGKNPKLCVCAGQRRLAALQLLADQGKINPDMNIPVKVLTEAEAVAASLIENESREPMLGYAPQVSCLFSLSFVCHWESSIWRRSFLNASQGKLALARVTRRFVSLITAGHADRPCC